MLKKFNNIINYTIVLAVLFLLMGIVLIIFPELSIITISYIISICLMVFGMILVIYSSDSFFINFLSFGILQIVLGVIILIYPNILTIIIPMVVGVWMILKSTLDFRLSLILKKIKNKNWIFVFILSILAIICGIILITNTQMGTITITVFVGIYLFAYSLTAIIDAIIFKKNINAIARELGYNKKD